MSTHCLWAKSNHFICYLVVLLIRKLGGGKSGHLFEQQLDSWYVSLALTREFEVVRFLDNLRDTCQELGVLY